MNRARLEELLHERGRALDGPLLLPERAQAMRGELQADARREARHTRRTRLLLLTTLAAAAAAILLLTRPWEPAARANYGELRVELALLDSLGRPLDRTERSPDPATFVRPEQVVLELLPEADGFLAIALYDPLGALWLPDAGAAHRLTAGELALIPIPLADLSTRAGADSIVGVLALTSAQAIAAERLRLLLPPHLDSAWDPGPSLARLATELAQTMSCSCAALKFTLALP